MKRLICLIWLLVFALSVSIGLADNARVVWYDEEASKAGVTNDSWMSLESDTDIYLYEGREFHMWTQYYGTDAITQEVNSIEVLLNGETFETYNDFFMDCHISYDVWYPLLIDGQYVNLTLKFNTVYGESEQTVPLMYNADVPPLCEEHTWQVNRQQETFAPCIIDSTKHYLAEAYYDRVCTVCGLVQRNEHQIYNEMNSPVKEAHQYGDDGICVKEGCGSTGMLTGRTHGFDEEEVSSYIREYDENGQLVKEYRVLNTADGEIIEMIKTYENGILANEETEHWSPDHERMLSWNKHVYNGHFLFESQEINDFEYWLGWDEPSGYSASCYSHFYPDVNEMAEKYGDNDYLLQTDYHKEAMEELNNEIRTNELFDVERFAALDDADKQSTLEQIVGIIARIYKTEYNELYIHMDGNHDFEDGEHIDGEAMYKRATGNVYVIYGSGRLTDTVSRLGHELRHSVQNDIVHASDEELSRYSPDTEQMKKYQTALSESFDYYWTENMEKLPGEQKKQLEKAAEDIADQLNIPDEYREVFCAAIIDQNLKTYMYRTQANETDTFIIENEVRQMMENR